MKSLPNSEIKQFATKPGPKQYLVFDELARRVRENPSSWIQERPWGCNALDITRALNASEMEWAFLKWSQRLSNENYELYQEQDKRLDKLERLLDQDPDSLEIKYFNAIGQELRKAGSGTVERPVPGVCKGGREWVN